ncbi:hypothetical protein HZ326_10907 [Fusarium oxysporum f. sp. albedinis]|nr:hypothetical protein HZ326_10907 [Fusarium oxysporum f. sp. albedinis]
MSLTPTRYSSGLIRLGAPQPGFIVGRELQLPCHDCRIPDCLVLVFPPWLCLPCPLSTFQHPALCSFCVHPS